MHKNIFVRNEDNSETAILRDFYPLQLWSESFSIKGMFRRGEKKTTNHPKVNDL